MKERPILFSDPMVNAILDGRKTQTRRNCKAANYTALSFVIDCGDGIFGDEEGDVSFSCPYGKPGDRMYVKEAHYRYGHWETVPGVRTKAGRQKWRFVPDSDEVVFDAPTEFRKGRHHKDPATPAWHKRSSLFMSRWASRITLEITGIRVERLKDISDSDALAEGVDRTNTSISGYAAKRFANLWESINGHGSWNANSWVWVIEFRRIENDRNLY